MNKGENQIPQSLLSCIDTMPPAQLRALRDRITLLLSLRASPSDIDPTLYANFQAACDSIGVRCPPLSKLSSLGLAKHVAATLAQLEQLCDELGVRSRRQRHAVHRRMVELWYKHVVQRCGAPPTFRAIVTCRTWRAIYDDCFPGYRRRGICAWALAEPFRKPSFTT